MGFMDRDESKEFPILCCYGLGITPLMGVVVEKFHDDKGIIWPAAIAPARVHLASIGTSDDVLAEAEERYSTLRQRGTSLLWDERDVTAGITFTDANLIGLP